MYLITLLSKAFSTLKGYFYRAKTWVSYIIYGHPQKLEMGVNNNLEQYKKITASQKQQLVLTRSDSLIPENTPLLAQAIKKNSRILALDLSNFRMLDVEIEILIKNLPPQIKKLDLSNARIGIKHAQMLADLIKTNQNLTILILDNNQLCAEKLGVILQATHGRAAPLNLKIDGVFNGMHNPILSANSNAPAANIDRLSIVPRSVYINFVGQDFAPLGLAVKNLRVLLDYRNAFQFVRTILRGALIGPNSKLKNLDVILDGNNYAYSVTDVAQDDNIVAATTHNQSNGNLRGSDIKKGTTLFCYKNRTERVLSRSLGVFTDAAKKGAMVSLKDDKIIRNPKWNEDILADLDRMLGAKMVKVTIS